MKQILLLLSVSIVFCSIVQAQTAEEYCKKASDLYDKKDFDKTIININKALATDSVNAKYLLLKGNAYGELHKYQEAFDTYSFGITFNPSDGYLYNQRGLLLMKVQQTEDAIKDFTDALEFEQTDTVKLSLLMNRGAAKIDIRDFQGAYVDFTEALKLDASNLGILNNLATVCDEVGKGDQTLKYLYKIIEIDSTFIGAYSNIGFKYQEMGYYDTAITFFNKVLALNPKEPLGYSNRAYNLYKLEHLDAALNDINMAINLYPGNSYAYRTRSLIYLSLKENAKACSDIEQALTLGFTKMYGDEVEKLKQEHCK